MKPVAFKPKSHPIKFKLSPELYGLVQSLSGLKGAVYHPADFELLKLQLTHVPGVDFRLYFVRGTQDGRGPGRHRLATVCIVKQVSEDGSETFHRGLAICHPKDTPRPLEGKCRAIRRVLRPLHSGKPSWARTEDHGVGEVLASLEFFEEIEEQLPGQEERYRYRFGAENVIPTEFERGLFEKPQEGENGA